MLLTLVILVIVMLTLLSMQYIYICIVITKFHFKCKCMAHTLYIYKSMRHIINQLPNDRRLVNDVSTSAAHAQTLSN